MSATVQKPPSSIEPLAVSAKRARELLDIGETTFWRLVKEGRLKMVGTGARRLVNFASLKALAGE